MSNNKSSVFSSCLTQNGWPILLLTYTIHSPNLQQRQIREDIRSLNAHRPIINTILYDSFQYTSIVVMLR